MTKKRGLDGGSEKVARIAAAGLYFGPGFNVLAFVSQIQAELDTDFPSGIVPIATMKTLKDVAEQVHMIAVAVNRLVRYPTNGAEIVISGPRIRWVDEIPEIEEFETQMVNKDSVFPHWEREGEYIIPTVVLHQYGERDIREVWARDLTNDFDRTAQKIAEWYISSKREEMGKTHPNQRMGRMEEYLSLFNEAAQALRGMKISSSKSVTVELKGIDFWLGHHFCMQGNLWGKARDKARGLGLNPDGLADRIIYALGLTLIYEDLYQVPEVPQGVRIFVSGYDHPKFEVRAGDQLKARMVSLGEANAVNGLDLWHTLKVAFINLNTIANFTHFSFVPTISDD